MITTLWSEEMQDEWPDRKKRRKRNHIHPSDRHAAFDVRDEELLPQADRKKRRAIKEALEELTASELAETNEEPGVGLHGWR